MEDKKKDVEGGSTLYEKQTENTGERRLEEQKWKRSKADRRDSLESPFLSTRWPPTRLIMSSGRTPQQSSN